MLRLHTATCDLRHPCVRVLGLPGGADGLQELPQLQGGLRGGSLSLSFQLFSLVALSGHAGRRAETPGGDKFRKKGGEKGPRRAREGPEKGGEKG